MISIRKINDTLTTQIRNMQNALSISGRNQILRRVGNRFLELSKSTFGGNAQYRGNKWPPLSSQYAKRVGGNTPTLLQSGALKQSLRVGMPRGSWIEVYTNNRYAAAQFLGSKKNNLPARRFMPVETSGRNLFRLTTSGEREIVNEISKALTQLSLGAFPRIYKITSRMKYERGSPTVGPS